MTPLMLLAARMRHSASSPKDYIIKLIGEEKALMFAEWAWGSDFKNMLLHGDQPVDKWNKLHGDKLTIYGSGRPQDDIPKMIELWQNETCQIKD